MRLGFIVDGKTELASFPTLMPKVVAPSGHTAVRTLLAPAHAAQPVDSIVKACRNALKALEALDVDQVVVVLDLETDQVCPGSRAEEIRVAVQRTTHLPIKVVLKNRMLENWIVADVEAVRSFSARFTITGAFKTAVSPNRADGSDAIQLLHKATNRKAYDKLQDGAKILKVSDPTNIAANSRSFRRLLRVVGHPLYSGQSRRPARPTSGRSVR
jgi:hypothetical protein